MTICRVSATSRFCDYMTIEQSPFSLDSRQLCLREQEEKCRPWNYERKGSHVLGTKYMSNTSLAILSSKYVKHITSFNTSHSIFYGGLLLTHVDGFSSWCILWVNWTLTRKLQPWPSVEISVHCFKSLNWIISVSL